MRRIMVVVVATLVGGCGGSDVVDGPPVLTGQVLGDAVAVALQEDLERRGVFGTSVGERGGVCRGAGARWECTVDVAIGDRVRDRRVYAVRARGDGCWVARQTGTDIGGTGRPSRPTRPGVLRGCVR